MRNVTKKVMAFLKVWKYVSKWFKYFKNYDNTFQKFSLVHIMFVQIYIYIYTCTILYSYKINDLSTIFA